MYFVCLRLFKFESLIETYEKRGPAVRFAKKYARENGVPVYVRNPMEKVLKIYFPKKEDK